MSTQCKRRFTRRGLLQRAEPPFRLSVMLWTVFQKLPIERRLERIAEAGYRSVELVTEFTEWSDKDFRRINAKPRARGMWLTSRASFAAREHRSRRRSSLVFVECGRGARDRPPSESSAREVPLRLLPRADLGGEPDRQDRKKSPARRYRSRRRCSRPA